MSEHVMTVALGPVQDFIAAARRTRDLWFGSRLLSEISKAAASAMKRAGATLIFPAEEALDDRDAGVANVILVTLREGLAPAEMRRIAWEGAKTCWDRYALRVRGMAEKIINTDIWDEQVKADDVIEFYAAAVPLESEADYGRARRRVMRLLAGRKTCRDFRPAKGYPVPKSSLDGQRESVLRKRDGTPRALPVGEGRSPLDRRDGCSAFRVSVLPTVGFATPRARRTLRSRTLRCIAGTWRRAVSRYHPRQAVAAIAAQESAMPTIDITGPIPTDGRRVFTPDALRFVGDLEARFGPVRTSLLEARRKRDAEIKAGASYGLLAETESIRRGSWKVAATPADLQRRHVEITGPVEPKMLINALNSGADIFMADFED